MANLIEKELQSFSEPKEVDYYCVECFFPDASYINRRLCDVFYCTLNRCIFLCRRWYFSVPTVYLSVTSRRLGIHTEIKWRSAFSWSCKSWKLEELVMSTLLLIRFVLILNPWTQLFWRLELNGDFIFKSRLVLLLSVVYPLFFCFHTFLLDEFPESSGSCTVAETIYGRSSCWAWPERCKESFSCSSEVRYYWSYTLVDINIIDGSLWVFQYVTHYSTVESCEYTWE